MSGAFSMPYEKFSYANINVTIHQITRHILLVINKVGQIPLK